MDRLIDKAYGFTKLWVSMAVTVMFAILVLGYQECIQGLEKPAGISEAIIFLFKYPGEYLGALVVGVILHIIGIVMLVAALICLLASFCSRIEFDIVIIINLFLGIAMIVLNIIFVRYVMLLAAVAAFTVVIVLAFLDSNN